jgi:hypothetical protein
MRVKNEEIREWLFKPCIASNFFQQDKTILYLGYYNRAHDDSTNQILS